MDRFGNESAPKIANGGQAGFDQPVICPGASRWVVGDIWVLMCLLWVTMAVLLIMSDKSWY